ncbi:MAG: hypothetical protein CMJ54_02560 [Planctomycetaceae bacterium]|nr:hypothetical protein [Planctomycetaceae bacterium]
MNDLCRTLLAAVVLACSSVTASAETITVCASGCQYTSLDMALQAAADGDRVEVGSGTYETEVAQVIDRSIKIVGAEDGSTRIVGSTRWTVSGPANLELASITILGDAFASIGFNVDAEASLVLDECQVIGVEVSSGEFGFIGAGPGVVGRVVLRGCVFDSCVVDATGSSGAFILAADLAAENITVRNCSLMGVNQYFFRPLVSGDFIDCRFEENEVRSFGLFNFYSPSLDASLVSCVFEGNRARSAFGNETLVTLGAMNSCVLDACEFVRNRADCASSSRWLGSVLIYGGTEVEIRNCRFASNDGRAIRLNEQGNVPNVGAVVVSGCRFIDNRPDPECWPFDQSVCPFGYAITIPIRSSPGGGEAEPSPLGGRMVISDSSFCGSGAIPISGSWIDGGGNCVSRSCDDRDGNGSLDVCLDDGYPRLIRVPGDAPDLGSALRQALRGQEIVLAPGDHVLAGLFQVSAADVVIRAEVPIAGSANSARIVMAEDPVTALAGIRIYASPGPGVVFQDLDLVLLDAVDDPVCSGSGQPTFEAGAIIAENSSLAFRGCRILADLTVPALAAFDSDLSFHGCEFVDDSDESRVAVIDAAHSDVAMIESRISSGRIAVTESSLLLSGTTVAGVTGPFSAVDAFASKVVVTGCDFRGNASTAFMPSGARIRSGSLRIEDSWFVDNDSPGEGTGVLQARAGAVLSLEGSAFCGNTPNVFFSGTRWRDLGANAFGDLGCARMVGDLDGDACVTAADLEMLLERWGVGGFPVADLDRDGVVGGSDLGILFSMWGRCP